ncbi:hypothetical protein ABBQ32_009717 [Trebouxia sp. C0010 RCD-2024]
MIQSSLENTNHIFCVNPDILFDGYKPLPAANARAKPQTSVSKQDRQWRSTENYGLSQKVCSTVQSSLRKCIDRIWLFCVSPDIPVDRCHPLQLSCDALATGSVKVIRRTHPHKAASQLKNHNSNMLPSLPLECKDYKRDDLAHASVKLRDPQGQPRSPPAPMRLKRTAAQAGLIAGPPIPEGLLRQMPK